MTKINNGNRSSMSMYQINKDESQKLNATETNIKGEQKKQVISKLKDKGKSNYLSTSSDNPFESARKTLNTSDGQIV